MSEHAGTGAANDSGREVEVDNMAASRSSVPTALLVDKKIQTGWLMQFSV